MTTATRRTITTATKTTSAMTTTVAIMTTAAVMTTLKVTTIAEGTIIAGATTTVVMTITVVTRNKIGKMTIVEVIIATATTDVNRGTTKGTTDHKMYTRSDGAHPTTIGEGPACQD